MKTSFILLTLLAAFGLHAADPEGLVSKSASGTTAARVGFVAGDRGFRLLVADATSDKAASVFSWRFGTTPTTVARAAAGSVTTLVTYATAIVSNDVVLIQATNGNVTNLTVWQNLTNTNALVYLTQPLSTNLAVSDTIRERLTNNYVLTTDYLSGTNLFIDNTNGLAASDLLLLETPAAANTSVVHAVSVMTNKLYRLQSSVPTPLTTNAWAYNILTNSQRVTASVAATGTNIPVAAINGFTNGHVILIRNGDGKESVRTVHAVTTTNIAILGTNGFTLDTNSIVLRLTNGVPIRFPSRIASRVIEAAATNSLSTNAVVITDTNVPPFLTRLESYVTNVVRYPVQLRNGPGFAIPEGFALGKLTNTHTLVLAATTNATAVVVDSATTLTNRDRIVLIPAGGGVVRNQVAYKETQILHTIHFTTTIGNAATVGDNLFLSSTPITSPVGATTARLIGSGLFNAPPGRPGQLTVDGTSAVTINQATADYGR